MNSNSLILAALIIATIGMVVAPFLRLSSKLKENLRHALGVIVMLLAIKVVEQWFSLQWGVALAIGAAYLTIVVLTAKKIYSTVKTKY